jgi:iron complex outermembrane recepter protein
MSKLNVSSSVRRAVFGSGLALGAALPLMAGESTPDPSEELAEVVVTGSRIRGAEPVGSAVISLDRESLESSGQVTVDRILKDIPQNFDLGVSENSRGQSGGNGNIAYGNTVNLRGIGPYATLVLLDGHRITNNSRSTDPSVIPTLGLERVEVIADGASAIYGSDAIAGVVNLIPRRNLDGAELFARGGRSGEAGFGESLFGGAWGKTWERGQFMVAFEHVDRSNLSGNDRDFFRADQRGSGGRDYRTTRCNPGTLLTAATGGTSYAIPAGGLTPTNVGSLVAGTSNLCDETPDQDLFPAQKYDSAMSTFTYEITPWASFFADGYYSKRSFVRHVGYANARLTVPQTNAWFVRPAGFTGTSYLIDYSFINDLPRNDSTGYAKNWQVTPGLRFQLPRDWQAEVLVGYGKTRDESNQYRGVNNTALNNTLASSDPATAFDPYGLGRTSAAVRAAISDQVFLAPTYNDFKGYELRLNGTLLDLPGGGLGLATGYERQELDVSLGSARGGPTTPIGWRYFGRTVDSGYAEFNVPLFGAGNARAGLQELTLNAAVRYDDYSDVGDTTNEKIGINWTPVQGLKLRASYGTSFRAPLIAQIYGNSNNLFVQAYQNPAGGPAIQGGVALSGQNLNLGPEKATTWSTGFDWDASSALRFSVTYFDVNYRGQVETYLSNLAILARETDFAGTGIILRGAAAATRVQELIDQGITVVGTLPGGSAANVPVFVDGRNQNLGVSNTRGFDFATTYTMDTDSSGSFQFMLNGTYLTTYEVAITSAAPITDRLNTIYNPLELKLRTGVNWSSGPLHASAVLTYVNGYDNNAVTPVEKVSAYMPVDLAFSADLGELGSNPLLRDLELGFEIRNALDEDPPYVNIAPNNNGSGGYDATASSPVGRLFALSLRKKW